MQRASSSTSLLLVLLLTSFAGAPETSAARARSATTLVGLNDVSILLPLPKNKREVGRMLAATDGDLIPSAVLAELPRLVNPDSDPDERLASLRVVAARFDPCFSEGTGPVTCRRQIRLVLQPVSFERSATVFDAAVHAFFDFNENDWASVVAEWRKTIQSGELSLPLQINPTIAREGLDGPSWSRLRALIAKFCTSSRLARVTSMSVSGFGTQWVFMGHELDAGQLGARIKIARIGRMAQAFFADVADTQEFHARIQPAPPGNDWLSFTADSQTARTELGPARLKAVMADAIAFENPERHNPGTLDCVSCHIAQTARLWGENEFTGWRADRVISAAIFASRRPLENTSENPFRINRVRAFGYFVDEPVISQRVINESALAADGMQNFLL